MPTAADATQKDAAAYVARLHQVAVTCKVKLGKVDTILTQAEAASAAQ